jgi:hypothetical protein
VFYTRSNGGPWSREKQSVADISSYEYSSFHVAAGLLLIELIPGVNQISADHYHGTASFAQAVMRAAAENGTDLY